MPTQKDELIVSKVYETPEFRFSFLDFSEFGLKIQFEKFNEPDDCWSVNLPVNETKELIKFLENMIGQTKQRLNEPHIKSILQKVKAGQKLTVQDRQRLTTVIGYLGG
jgi:hypothetical protein